MRPRPGQQRRQLGGIGRDLIGWREKIVGLGAVEDDQLKPARRDLIGGGVGGAVGAQRRRIEQPEPALAATAADFWMGPASASP